MTICPVYAMTMLSSLNARESLRIHMTKVASASIGVPRFRTFPGVETIDHDVDDTSKAHTVSL